MNTEKHPVPDSKSDHFMGIIWSLVEPFGIDKIPEVFDYVTMLSESIERHNFEQRYKVSPQQKGHDDRKKYIAIFKARYLEFTDLKYTRKLLPCEGRLIKQTNKTLEDSGFTAEEYLKWTFEEFFIDSPKFAPGTIKQTCSEVFLHKFLTDKRDIRDERKKADVAKKEGHALLNKARQMIRASSDDNLKENVKNLVKQYSDGSIMMSEFRTGLNKLAKK